MEAPVLKHFKSAKLIILQLDATGFGITGIFNQNDSCGILKLVRYTSVSWHGPNSTMIDMICNIGP